MNGPAIFGTLFILVACILLTLVTCSVPLIKSITFLTATVGGGGNQAGQTITFGCLGYCIGSACHGPTIGYSFDPTQLLGIASSVGGVSINSGQYSSTVIKGLTYTLILHPIALAASALTLLFGLMAMCSNSPLCCINGIFGGIASIVTGIAVGCDFALFIIARKRINSINGANATLGTALWMTLVALVLIIFSSFTFCCSCCSGGGGGGRKNRKRDVDDDDAWKVGGARGGNNYADQMRMDALDAEADRKRRNVNDLPKFAVYETEHVESLPLKHDYEDAGAAGFAANGLNSQHSHGYGNQYGYADGGYAEYTPTSENGPHTYGGYGNAYNAAPGGSSFPMDSYIPGVGPGAQRAVPAATAYYDNTPGALSQSTGNEPSTYPGYNDATSSHSYAAQPQDGDAYGAMGAVPPVSQNHHDQQYSNAGHGQFQSSTYDHARAYYNQEEAYNHGDIDRQETMSPYDAVQQATAAGRSRTLPPTTPTSPVRSGPGSRTGGPSTDDGFGLSVLQRGAAAAAVGSPDGEQHDTARVQSPVATYGEDKRGQWASPTPTRQRALPVAPNGGHDSYSQNQYDYGSNSEHASRSQPPGYEDLSDAYAYDGRSRRY